MSGDVPKGWTLETLGEITSIVMGQSPASDTYNRNRQGIPFFQGKADFGGRHPRVRVWCTSPLKIARKNSILLSVRAPVGDINICNVEACIGRGLASIIGTKIENSYLFQFMSHSKNDLEALGQGSTFDAVNVKELKTIQICLPPPMNSARSQTY